MDSFFVQFLINISSNIESLLCVYFFSIPMKKRYSPWFLYPLTLLLSFGFIALFALIRSASIGILTGILVTILMNVYQLGFLFLLTKETVTKTIVEYIGAFALNFIVAQLLGLPDIFLGENGFLPFLWTTGNIYGDLFLRLLIRAVICFPFARLFSFSKEVSDDKTTRKVTIITISLASLFVAILSRLSSLIPSSDAIGTMLLSLAMVSFCFLVLYLRTRIFDYSRQQAEILAMQAVIDSQNRQYEHFRDSVSYVNTVCHDLKKQLNIIRDKLDEEEFASLQNALSLYNGRFKTGNDALDMVLYQSRLQCEKKKIKLTVLGDGSAIGFIRHYDAYALLSNALSNAIEACEKISNPQKRIISVVIDRRPPFAIIDIENYFEGEIKRRSDGDIESDKKDNRLHGLGVKSMRRILEEYDGQLTIRAEDGIFALLIAIPLVEEKKVHDAK